ncbi:AAA family ATPase [Longimicrobium sp.]|uniref:AAA family ATPase n=1 Tax=Longimicrobium sp. TaxID=2029185 RepID=UPI002E30D9AF|nr:AAA family ATPase [Longimicrobium sp.]HEX6037918.1 AAA family ATPase [Longimicrobium sp.]
MKIKRFSARGIHGYLDFDLEFDSEITFLTGINGSGKTTVVTGISALISPSLSFLAQVRYTRMEVEIEHEGMLLQIGATRTDESLILSSSVDAEALEIPILRDEVPISSGRISDQAADFYQEQEARRAAHPVLRRLKALPTPMFLGLERRASSFFPQADSPFVHAVRRRTHNVFSSSLSRSLVEAAAMAEQSYTTTQARHRELADRLKRQLILSSLKYEPADFSISTPPTLTPVNIASVRATLKEIGISEKEIALYLDPFVEKLREISSFLPFPKDFKEIAMSRDKPRAVAYIEWITNKPQFDRLTTILRDVDRHIAATQRANKPLNNYLDIVNNFLGDSNKTLSFARTGNLVVSIRGGATRPITALSSGESQLVVILTHLAFNPAAQGANVFIVDEPELSLHLRWQELFVPAIRALNPQLQAILATHSPAIIMDDLAHCVDLSVAVKR